MPGAYLKASLLLAYKEREGRLMSNDIIELNQLLTDIDIQEANSIDQQVEIDVNDVDYELRMGSAIATIVVKC